MVALHASAVAPSLARLTDAVDALQAEHLDGLTDGALGDDIIALRRQIERLEAECSRRLFRFDEQRGYASEGAVSMQSWLRHHCNLSGSAAAMRVEVARMLPQLPSTERALRDGDIGFQHASLIARTAADLGAERVHPAEPVLVDAAKRLDPARLRVLTRHVRHCVDPDRERDAANHDHHRRWLHLSQTLDGIFVLDGQLDAEGGALLRTAINALDKPIPDDDRTPAQRRADAIIELATRQLQRGDLPAVAGQRPHLTVTASAPTLRHAPGAPAGELNFAGPVIADLVRRLACDASVTHITVAASGEPLDVGRTTRTIPPALRRALVTRDHGCRFPGCDRPPEWTDAHHLVHWADGGETRLDNLVLLCRHHHRFVHERGWRLELSSGGDAIALPP